MRLYKTKILGLAGVITATVVFASGAFASAAMASPVWVVKGKALTSNAEKQPITSHGLSTHKFHLNTRNAAGEITNTIECTEEKNTGELIGGEPGTDKANVTFTGCKDTHGSGEGCVATSTEAGKAKGVIGPFEVKTALGYPSGVTPPDPNEAYDQFFPVGWKGEPNVFVEFKLEECLASGTTVKVEATGTEVGSVKGEAIDRKCGVIAEVGKIVNGAFVVTKSGEEAEEGALNFPTPPITSEWLDEEIEPGVSEFVPVTCTLEAETTSVLGKAREPAEEVGVTVVETVPKTLFGWKV